MANSIFNNPAFNFFGRPTMDDFLKNAAHAFSDLD